MAAVLYKLGVGRQLYERLPGAEVVILDRPGHSPMVEEPEKTLALIEDFLARPESDCPTLA